MSASLKRQKAKLKNRLKSNQLLQIPIVSPSLYHQELHGEHNETVDTQIDDVQDLGRSKRDCDDSGSEDEEDTDGYQAGTLFQLSNGDLRQAREILEGDQIRSIRDGDVTVVHREYLEPRQRNIVWIDTHDTTLIVGVKQRIWVQKAVVCGPAGFRAKRIYRKDFVCVNESEFDEVTHVHLHRANVGLIRLKFSPDYPVVTKSSTTKRDRSDKGRGICTIGAYRESPWLPTERERYIQSASSSSAQMGMSPREPSLAFMCRGRPITVKPARAPSPHGLGSRPISPPPARPPPRPPPKHQSSLAIDFQHVESEPFSVDLDLDEIDLDQPRLIQALPKKVVKKILGVIP